jgi:hypothetical protein
VFTVEDLIRALSKHHAKAPVAIIFRDCDGDEMAMPVERVVRCTAAQVLMDYGLEIVCAPYSGPVAAIHGLSAD